MNFRPSRKLKVSASLDMTPLIDVVFQLILFFMLSSTFVVQSSIPIEMPEARGAKTQDRRDITVTLVPPPGGPDSRGPIYFNDTEVKSMDELGTLLADAHRERPEVVVMIRPDSRVDTGRLVEVLGIANSVGVTRYQIAAQPSPEGPPQ